MLRMTDQAVVVAGTPLQPPVFPKLVKRHPAGVEMVLSLEAEGRRLVTGDFTDKQLHDFIRGVCQWGGYPRTADRVLTGNVFAELRQRFSNAIQALTADKPRVILALRELRRVRHLGLSFATKHLRLMRPDVCPVLDSVLSDQLGYSLNLPGYKRFSGDCMEVARLLEGSGVDNPLGREDDAWYAADVEMALYVYVKLTAVQRAEIFSGFSEQPPVTVSDGERAPLTSGHDWGRS